MNSFEFVQLEVPFDDKESLHSLHIMNSEDSQSSREQSTAQDTLFNEKEVAFSGNKSNEDYLEFFDDSSIQCSVIEVSNDIEFGMSSVNELNFSIIEDYFTSDVYSNIQKPQPISAIRSFSSEELAILEPIIVNGNKFQVYEAVFGNSLECDTNPDYKQPVMKKWTNAALCHQILHDSVVQIDASQFFPMVASIYLDQSNPSAKVISDICAKFVALREDLSCPYNSQVKDIVNTLIGYLATTEEKKAKMEPEMREQVDRHRCTEIHRVITQTARDIMDELERGLIARGIVIIAFKSDSVFIIDKTGEYTTFVTNYFKQLGFKSKVIKYAQFIHAESRNSDEDVSYYMGITEHGALELNGIGIGVNNHLIESTCRRILNGEEFNIAGSITAEYYQDFLQLAENNSDESLYELTKKHGFNKEFKYIRDDVEYTMKAVKYGKKKVLKGYQRDITLSDIDFYRNDRILKQTIQQIYRLKTRNSQTFISPYQKFEYLDEFFEDSSFIQVKVDAYYRGLENKVVIASKDGAYSLFPIEHVEQLVHTRNLSVHEAFTKSEGRLFFDIDCKRSEHPKWYGMTSEELSGRLIKMIKTNDAMLNQKDFKSNVLAYKTVEKHSIHIVCNIVVPFEIQSKIAYAFSCYFSTNKISIIDLALYKSTKTFRLPFCQKISKSGGITKDCDLRPIGMSSTKLKSYFITHCLENVPKYRMPEFLFKQNSLSIVPIIDQADESGISGEVPQIISEQLKSQYNIQFQRLVPSKDTRRYGRIIVSDYAHSHTKCPFCGGKHDQLQNRTNLQYCQKRVDGRSVIEIATFQCQDRKNNKPLVIEIGEQVARKPTTYRYEDRNQITFSSQFVARRDYSKIVDKEERIEAEQSDRGIPIENTPQLVEFINSDMGTGKSTRYGQIIKQNQAGLFLGVRKSQTRDFTKTYGITSYEDIQGPIDVQTAWAMVQVDSIMRVVSYGQIVIIDEFMSILAHIQSLKDAGLIFKKLAQIILESHQVYIGDNFLEQSVVDVIQIFLRQFAPDKKWTIKSHFNGFKTRQGNIIELHTNFSGNGQHNMSQMNIDQIISQIVNACNINSQLHDSPNQMGRCACFIGSKKLIERLKEILTKMGYRVQDYHGGDNEMTENSQNDIVTMKDKKMQDFEDMVTESDHWNIILYSQTITVGVNIPNPKFTHGVHYFKNKTGSQIQFLQGIERFRMITKHVVFANDMVDWDLSATRNKTLEQAYRNTELLNEDREYFALNNDTKAAIMLETFTRSFYHCLGLLGIDYSVQKWKSRGYEVVIKNELCDQSIVPIKYTSPSQRSFSDLNPLMFPDNYSGVQGFVQKVSVDLIDQMLRDKVPFQYNQVALGNDEFYKKYPCGSMFSTLVQLYNANYRTNLYEQIKQEFANQADSRKQLADLPYGDLSREAMYKSLNNAPFQKSAMQIHQFASNIESSYQLNSLKSTLEAQTVYRNHLPAVQIFQTITDKKQRDKRLRSDVLRLDPENPNVLVKGDKPLSINGMKGFISMLDDLQMIEPELFALIGKDHHQSQKPQKFIDWCTKTPEGIKCRQKEKMLQILGYDVHYYNGGKTGTGYDIYPIGKEQISTTSEESKEAESHSEEGWQIIISPPIAKSQK